MLNIRTFLPEILKEALSNFYQLVREKVVEANVKKDIGLINEIIPMMKEIRDAFAEASRMVK